MVVRKPSICNREASLLQTFGVLACELGPLSTVLHDDNRAGGESLLSILLSRRRHFSRARFAGASVSTWTVKPGGESNAVTGNCCHKKATAVHTIPIGPARFKLERTLHMGSQATRKSFVALLMPLWAVGGGKILHQRPWHWRSGTVQSTDTVAHVHCNSLVETNHGRFLFWREVFPRNFGHVCT